jgi:hypothetical protein
MADNNELITLGFNIGLYSAAQMILEGLPTSDLAMRALKETASQDIQKATGAPIEDFASMIDPMMEEVVKIIKDIDKK